MIYGHLCVGHVVVSCGKLWLSCGGSQCVLISNFFTFSFFHLFICSFVYSFIFSFFHFFKYVCFFKIFNFFNSFNSFNCSFFHIFIVFTVFTVFTVHNMVHTVFAGFTLLFMFCFNSLFFIFYSAFRRGGPTSTTQCKRITSQHQVRKTHKIYVIIITRQDT